MNKKIVKLRFAIINQPIYISYVWDKILKKLF